MGFDGGSTAPAGQRRRLGPWIVVLAWVALLGCTRAARPPRPPPQVTSATLSVSEQDFSGCLLTVAGTVDGQPVQARYEVVVDGTVVSRAEAPLSGSADGGAFVLRQRLVYAPDVATVQRLSERETPLLVAVRGEVETRDGETSARAPFASAVEVRAPRLPRLVLAEVEAGRFSESQVEVVFHLSVVNPNPFPVRLSGVQYQVVIAARPLAEGTVGTSDVIPAGAGSVFDIAVPVLESTYGPDVQRLIASKRLPYTVTATARAGELSVELSSRAELRLP